MSLIFLSIPGLRERDLVSMPKLRELTRHGETATLVPSFPSVTCPVQANMTTGKTPAQHGVIANGFYWRDKRQVEMWTAWNDCIQSPQIWDILGQHDDNLTTAVWFPLHSKGAGADFICTPAPIHNPDGSESLWCYTRPTEMYGELRDKLGDFPLKHFWGPLANIKSTAWIVDSAIIAAREYRPDFFCIYLPHLDYAAQKNGPDSAEAQRSVTELDEQIGKLGDALHEAYSAAPPHADPLPGGEGAMPGGPTWLVASEYAIVPVDHVLYPNRMLREAGLLTVREEPDGEHLDFAASRAWALVDHQFSHVFVQPGDIEAVSQVRKRFEGQAGVAEVLVGDQRGRYHLDHERSGEVILVSAPNSWQAYYWWLDDAKAPGFAKTVDIHRKPGYDPVELFFDPQTRSIPLSAGLVKGSHGAPAESENQRGVILSSASGVLGNQVLVDTQVFDIVLRQFGC
jgi:predicted AlkP superfamily pyrophosphatase or phosphodiesterase